MEENETTAKKSFNSKKLIICILAAVIAICLLSLAAILAYNHFRYQSGIKALQNKDYYKAVEIFKEYPDAEENSELLSEAYYEIACSLLEEGKSADSLKYFDLSNGYSDSAKKSAYISAILDAEKLLENKDYEKALELLSDIEKTDEIAEKINAANYGIAKGKYADGDYLEAIEYYKKTEGYKDSQKQIENCYYSLGIVSEGKQEYEKAIEYFKLANGYEKSDIKIKECHYELGLIHLDKLEFDMAKESFIAAGDYKDAPEKVIAADYYNGHQLFISGKYAEAAAYFEKSASLDTTKYPLHFENMIKAESYIREQGDKLSEAIEIYIGELPSGIDTIEEIILLMYNYIPVRSVGINYSSTTKLLSVYPYYYPGHRIVYAHENQMLSILSEDEKVAYEKAKALVESAKSEAKDLISLELWLHDWICNNTVYDDPAVVDSTHDYRQLNCMGVLMDGKANCQGYADAFYLLSSLAGFDTRIVGSDDHAWNAIKINNSWYAVDCTFNDIDSQSVRGISYIWFNSPFADAEHILYGGNATFPWLCAPDDYTASFHSTYGYVYYSVDRATAFMARQNVKYREKWTYIVIKGSEVSQGTLSAALEDALYDIVDPFSYKYWYEYHDIVNGNTYFTVYWYL